MRRYRTTTIPEGAHPLVRLLYLTARKERMGILDMAERAGVGQTTLFYWRKRNEPSISNLEACFNVLGYELTVRKRPD